MEKNTPIYIAGIGMLGAIGFNTASTAAAVRAHVSGYQLSDFDNEQGNPITMSCTPQAVFDECLIDIQLPADTKHIEYIERIIKMGYYALKDAFSSPQVDLDTIKKRPVPLIYTMPEPLAHQPPVDTHAIINNIVTTSEMPVNLKQVHSIHSGRAAAIEGLDLAYRYLNDLNYDYVLVGGSDSYRNIALINQLDKAERLLSTDNKDGFAPGEAAGFLLLTRHPQLALQENKQIIMLHPPGVSEEEGHLYSKAPYLGEGLDRAFKQALSQYKSHPIRTIYSSMNGENFWAKELGVSVIRNKRYLEDPFTTEHPADCCGDLGAATGSILIGLSASSLLKHEKIGTHMVYSSSDGPKRAAVCVEKIALQSALDAL